MREEYYNRPTSEHNVRDNPLKRLERQNTSLSSKKTSSEIEEVKQTLDMMRNDITNLVNLFSEHSQRMVGLEQTFEQGLFETKNTLVEVQKSLEKLRPKSPRRRKSTKSTSNI